MSQKIYIVVEYDYKSTDIICSFYKKEDAEAYIKEQCKTPKNLEHPSHIEKEIIKIFFWNKSRVKITKENIDEYDVVIDKNFIRYLKNNKWNFSEDVCKDLIEKAEKFSELPTPKGVGFYDRLIRSYTS